MIRTALLCLWLATPLAAQETAPVSAADAAVRLSEARAAMQAADDADDRIAALSGAVRAYEDGLIALQAGLRIISTRETALSTALDAKSADIGQLLGVLQTISRTPAPAMALHPDGAVGTVRSGMVVADVIPALQEDATALRAEISELADVRAERDTAETQLREGLIGVQEARTALRTALENRTPLPRRFEEDPVQTALLIASSNTLGAFADSLAQVQDAGLPNDTTLAAKGALPLPVTGRVLSGFGATDSAGVQRSGILIATPPRALVVSPTPATILFQGPLLSFDTVVVIEPTAGVVMFLRGWQRSTARPERSFLRGHRWARWAERCHLLTQN